MPRLLPISRRAVLRRAALAFAVALPGVVLAQGAARAQDQATTVSSRLTLVTTNDLDRMGDSKGRGGFAKLAAVLKHQRLRGDVLFLHAGDAYSPSILAGFDKGFHIVDLFNRMGVDAFVPGNHEFDFGPENFRARVRQSTFPVIASNLAEADGSPVAGTVAERVVTVAGVRVGIFGVTTEDTKFLASPGDIAIAPALDAARAAGERLRGQGAEIVVALAHTPFSVDLAMQRARVADVIVSGHDHNLVNLYDGRVLLTESESQAETVTVIDLLVDKTTREGKTTVSWRPVVTPLDTLNVTPDPEIAAAVGAFQAELDKELDVPVGVTATPLDTRRGAVRGLENAFGNMLCDAMRAAVSADLCITNSGGIRADREYPAGATLTRKSILEELPFGNRTVMLEVTGEVVRAAIENGLRGGGRFPQVSGMVVKGDLTKPAGERVVSITVGGAPLDPAKTYTLATNDFMARGGDAYEMFVGAKQLIDPLAGQLMAGQLMEYIRTRGTVSPVVEGRLDLVR
jgi:2',3'-cyclic-nucleotide 2'-phosphodiesterase (5'-nucleotidase family)